MRIEREDSYTQMLHSKFAISRLISDSDWARITASADSKPEVASDHNSDAITHSPRPQMIGLVHRLAARQNPVAHNRRQGLISILASALAGCFGRKAGGNI